MNKKYIFAVLAIIAAVCLFAVSCPDRWKSVTGSETVTEREKQLQDRYDSLSRAYTSREAFLQTEINENLAIADSLWEITEKGGKAVIKYVVKYRTATGSEKLTDCDSIAKICEAYVDQSRRLDSTDQSVIEQQREALEISRRHIADLDTLLSDGRKLVDDSRASIDDLAGKLKVDEKKLKRRSFFNKVLAGITLVAVGVLTERAISAK